jgi:hypothetical protein
LGWYGNKERILKYDTIESLNIETANGGHKMILSTKSRLQFKRGEIENLMDEEVIEFQIVAKKDAFSSDSREINGVFRCTVGEVKNFFDWKKDKDWFKGSHSWSSFPASKEKFFKGKIGNRVID